MRPAITGSQTNSPSVIFYDVTGWVKGLVNILYHHSTECVANWGKRNEAPFFWVVRNWKFWYVAVAQSLWYVAVAQSLWYIAVAQSLWYVAVAQSFLVCCGCAIVFGTSRLCNYFLDVVVVQLFLVRRGCAIVFGTSRLHSSLTYMVCM